MTCHFRGDTNESLDRSSLSEILYTALDELGTRRKVLAIPPDFTRFHSQAGVLTELVFRRYGKALTDVLPALGTHVPMTKAEIGAMYGDTPKELFRVHDFRNEIETLGIVPAAFIREVSEGKLDWEWPAQVNRMLTQGGYDLILSIGQVVPHEVSGMANHNKNIFVGTGGADGINKSHYLGAVYGLERIMGRADNPVRQVLNYASEHFAWELPIVYVLTVVAADSSGRLHVRGLFVGDGVECFERAAALSLEVNFEVVQQPLRKVVVYLD
ncbi:MAG: lactate racemase domain-containing protein, partial [Spirochaetaceae bacterium]